MMQFMERKIECHYFDLKRCFELATTTPKCWIFPEIISIHRIMANLNQTWIKASLGDGIQVCSNEGQHPSFHNLDFPNIYWNVS